MLRILMAFMLLFIFIGCDEANTQARKDRENNQKTVELCISQGGIPILSTWDRSMLKDCIFKPK